MGGFWWKMGSSHSRSWQDWSLEVNLDRDLWTYQPTGKKCKVWSQALLKKASDSPASCQVLARPRNGSRSTTFDSTSSRSKLQKSLTSAMSTSLHNFTRLSTSSRVNTHVAHSGAHERRGNPSFSIEKRHMNINCVHLVDGQWSTNAWSAWEILSGCYI